MNIDNHFRNNGSGQSQSTARAPAKRNRIQLSCSNCRHSKLKCDRNSPCGPCLKKGRECIFPAPAPRKKAPVSMQNRMRHLESLVKDVMSGQTPAIFSASQIPSSNGNVERSPLKDSIEAMSLKPTNGSFGQTEPVPSGQILAGNNESTYVGATHWAAILGDIEEVKSYFQEENITADEDIKPYTSLVYNADSPLTQFDLLEALPERLVVDRLVSRYFNSNSPALHIIHKPTFEHTLKYRDFWIDPESHPISFLGLLYSTMLLATIGGAYIGRATPEPGENPMDMICTFRSCCVQCLVLSNYTRPGPHTMETLLIYLEAMFLLTRDDQMQCYLLVGNAVRLALRMGLHRDPTKVGGNITPYQAEMRRRLWHQLIQIDLLCSSHTGLPGMMQSIESDTLSPRNLSDEDFDENSTELPPSRSETQLTPMSYTIGKGRICCEASKITALANRLTLPPYEEVVGLDKLLNEAFEKVPSFFKLTGSEVSITDTSERIIKRFTIATLYQRSRCLLHRKFLMQVDTHPEYIYSKNVGLEASMELLHYQEMVHRSCFPGGPLAGDRWFLTSLSMHDFLLAAMIIYMSLTHLIQEDVAAGKIGGALSPQGHDLLRSLKTSYSIWNEMSGDVAEATKAKVVIGGMLHKVYAALGHEFLLENNHVSSNGVESQLNGFQSMGTNTLSISGDSIPSMAPASTTPSWDLGTPMDFDFNSSLQPLGSMIDMPNDFDWDSFDKHFFPNTKTDTPQLWPDSPQDIDLSLELVNDNSYYQ